VTDDPTAADSDLSAFRVQPGNWGESIVLEHGECVVVAEWDWDVTCDLFKIVAAARDHLLDAHGEGNG
jgi:hypothetical protein